MEKCITCKFFEKQQVQQGDKVVGGICRFNPPVPILVPKGAGLDGMPRLVMTPGWSPVSVEDWCGHYIVATI